MEVSKRGRKQRFARCKERKDSDCLESDNAQKPTIIRNGEGEGPTFDDRILGLGHSLTTKEITVTTSMPWLAWAISDDKVLLVGASFDDP